MNKSLIAVIAIVVAAMVGGFFFLIIAGLAFFSITSSSVEVVDGREPGVMMRVQDFDQVSVCCGMHLFLEQGPGHSVRLEGDRGELRRIRTIVQDDTLVIDYERGLFGFSNLLRQRPVSVYVTAPTYQVVETSGGSRLFAAQLDVDDLDLHISGGGEVRIEQANADSLDLDLSGGTDMSIGGSSVDELHLSLSGGGDFDGESTRCRTAQVDISGGSRATLWVTDELAVDASGGSRVSVYGMPDIKQNTSGGSRVEPLGDR